jgi:hypothetical protein
MNAALEAAEGKFSPRPDENYRPYQALAEVLRIFGETKDSWGLAFWFSGLKGFLDDGASAGSSRYPS